MEKSQELTYKQLTGDEYYRVLTFKTTEDIECSDRLIGQERAEKAMNFGVSIKEKGYNIFICGKNGSGRLYYARNFLSQISDRYETPEDWCYVYNFDNEYEPIALNFQSGIAKLFKQDIECLIDEIIEKIPSEFSSQEYDKQKNEILEDYHDKKNELVDELSNSAETYNLQVKPTNNGFAFVPVHNGKPMSENEYDNLDRQEKDIILKDISLMRIKAVDILRKLKTAEKDASEKVKSLDDMIGLYIVESIIENYKSKYSDYSKVYPYLENVKKDVLKNLSVFVNGIDRCSLSKEEEELLLRYKVNVIMDNSQTNGAPVIYEPNPTYTNLIGNVEYESNSGTLTTDFLMIRPGSILKANGGYLILNIKDILKNYKAWEGLKRAIGSNELRIESIRNQLDLLTISTIKPETIPIRLKVVIIGIEELYQLLYEYDDGFSDLFKVKVDFDTDMEKSEENILKVAQFIAHNCSKKNIRHLDNTAVSAVIEYCSKLSGSRKRLSTCLEKIIDLVEESNIWAEISGSNHISRQHIKMAVADKKKRVNLIEEKMLRNYRDRKIIIDVNSEAVGQINGLSVIDMGGYTFGKPCRITASTYMGKNGITNIEREVQMSGNIHSKSVMIISGYLGKKYARSIPLSLTAHICFEQLYGFIDGDSASIAELYALLSSLSGIPLKQSIAVTGSLNQMGEVQPVGGINEKIEGFYKVCCMHGINGSQGVIIPYQNIDDIMLDDNILKDIQSGLFHIYAIKDFEEGIDILTGVKAGGANDKGEFETGTFNYYVDKRLKELIKNYNDLENLKLDKGNN